ncbi:ribosome maturation factor RimP [Cellulosimicrobium composti]|uniref:Ribosome maturation factor RimP n=1 Tax=Cellulosimicrobium composti TaxID=2672572 RepID=A0A6N7ZK94_9MICO|nr:ribosome maturation factor RimP [Cellulosimicrobium composti]MTG89770.1 ribosome maturation factor RimP [Cellulosimicrobium composti]NDO89221.1 ribosome maturation factor RimP [Cellulosimicrobium composti]
MAGQAGGQPGKASGGDAATHALRESVREAVEPAVRDAGLHLEDVAVSRAGARSVVRVVLDLPDDVEGNLDLDTVAEATRPISTALDAVDRLHGAYTLEVSTPGTDRPLTEPRHFRRARGRLVRLVLADGGTVEGRLRSGSPVETELHLDVPGKRGVVTERVVPLADVVRGHVEVELKRALEADLPGLDDADDASTDDTTAHDEEA